MKEDIISFPQNNSLPFQVSMCGISYCDGAYKIIRQNSDINNIEYVISGTGTVNVNGKTFYPGAGDVFFLKAGENHLYYSDSEQPWVKIWMNFSGRLADKITDCYGLKNKHHFKATELRRYFDDIYNVSRSNLGAKAICNKCTLIFTELAQQLAALCDKEQAPICNIASNTRAYIDDMTDFSASLDEISTALSYSKNHIIRSFKDAFGITPYEYILNRRFELAESLLINTASPISEIAEQLGFCDARYFSGCFSKRYGITPTEFRKKQF